jgi:hypothetical protein
MTAPDAEYKSVLGELDTICDSITHLLGTMDLAGIQKHIESVSKQSNDQMDMLKKLKVKIGSLNAEISSLREENKNLEDENTMLRTSVTRVVIVDAAKEGDAGSTIDDESVSLILCRHNGGPEGGEGEGGEGEGGEEEEQEGGEGGEGEGEGGEGEGGEGEGEDEEDEEEQEEESEDELVGEEDKEGFRIWRADEIQINIILDYIENNVFVDGNDRQLYTVGDTTTINPGQTIEPKFKYRFGGSQGTKLNAKNFRNLIKNILDAYKTKFFKTFELVERSKFKTPMKDHLLWGPGLGNYRLRTIEYLRKQLLGDDDDVFD